LGWRGFKCPVIPLLTGCTMFRRRRLLIVVERGEGSESVVVTFKMPKRLLMELDEFVAEMRRAGVFASRSEFIRYAIVRAMSELRAERKEGLKVVATAVVK